MPTASSRHLSNLKNWLETYPEAIDPQEQHFEGKEGDLFPIIRRQRSPLASILHKFEFLRFLFPVTTRPDRFASSSTIYHSDIAFEYMIFVVTGPMWWLHYVEEPTTMLGIITAFVTLFAVWLWIAAGPRQFEVLLGTAAYAAVLYIYIQAANSSPSASQ